MRIRTLEIAALLAFALLSACQSAPRASTDYDPDADFSKFQTFTWIDPNPVISTAGQRPMSPFIEQRLMNESRTALENRGLRFVEDPEQADLAVAFTLGSREGIRVTNFPTSSFHMSTSHARRMQGWHGYWGSNRIRTTQYTEGQLAIDLFDIEAQSPVWHGTVSQRINQSDRDDPSNIIGKTVGAIFERFPPS